jgi:hypothetical protein
MATLQPHLHECKTSLHSKAGFSKHLSTKTGLHKQAHCQASRQVPWRAEVDPVERTTWRLFPVCQRACLATSVTGERQTDSHFLRGLWRPCDAQRPGHSADVDFVCVAFSWQVVSMPLPRWLLIPQLLACRRRKGDGTESNSGTYASSSDSDTAASTSTSLRALAKWLSWCGGHAVDTSKPMGHAVALRHQRTCLPA